jgi:hypothetical protein
MLFACRFKLTMHMTTLTSSIACDALFEVPPGWYALELGPKTLLHELGADPFQPVFTGDGVETGG